MTVLGKTVSNAVCPYCNSVFERYTRKQIYCTRNCREAYMRTQPDFQEKRRALWKNWATKNRVRLAQRDRSRDWTPERKQAKRDRDMLMKFGLENGEYERILESQHGVCAVCRQPETNTYLGVVRNLAVDHDHESGAVRALLCRRCNLILGTANDDPELLLQLTDYLLKFQDQLGVLN